MARNDLPSSASGISSIKQGRPVSAPHPPLSDRSQTALCPYCKQTFALFSEEARGWNTRPQRQCIKCYRRRRVRRSGASPRVNANTPTLRDGWRIRASVIAKRLRWGQPAVIPRVADAADIVAVVETIVRTCFAPLASWPMRPTTSSLRGSGAEPYY